MPKQINDEQLEILQIAITQLGLKVFFDKKLSKRVSEMQKILLKNPAIYIDSKNYKSA